MELVAIYWTHCRQYYRKVGKPTDHLHVVKQALRTLKDCYGREPAERVGPLALRAVQQRLIEAGHARTYINEQVPVIRRMYRWAVTEEQLPVSIY